MSDSALSSVGNGRPKKRLFVSLFTHLAAVAFGFALGIYLLPILTAPDSPDAAVLESSAKTAMYQGDFTKDLDGSDLFHWGTGRIYLSSDSLVHQGELAPGPDYMAYLAPSFVTNEEEFLAIKDQSRSLGSVKTFQGFMLPINEPIDLTRYRAVVIWCEAFSEFITAATLRPVK